MTSESSGQIKKYVLSGDDLIIQFENGGVSVFHKDKQTKAALRMIADREGFQINPEWNCQYFPFALMKFLNNK